MTIIEIVINMSILRYFFLVYIVDFFLLCEVDLLPCKKLTTYILYHFDGFVLTFWMFCFHQVILRGHGFIVLSFPY